MRIKNGFTLIEIIMAMMIIALISLVAYPNYIEYSHKARRAQLITDIMSCAANLERQYTYNHSYSDTACDDIRNAHYQLNLIIDCSQTNNCFVISATAVSQIALLDSKCQVFNYNHLSLKSALDNETPPTDNTDFCW